jgi:glycosidase
MPWRAPANDYEVVNVELQTGRTGSLLEHYRSLLALRTAHSSMRTGTVTLLETGNPGVYVALRTDGNETILILANLTDLSITDYALTLKSADMTASAYEAKVLFGQGQPNGPERTGEAFPKFKPFEQLPPYAMYVIQLNPK